MLLLLLLILGVGLSLLSTELSVKLASRNGTLVAAFTFFGYLACLLVGYNYNGESHGEVWAGLFYWMVVGFGVLINVLSKDS